MVLEFLKKMNVYYNDQISSLEEKYDSLDTRIMENNKFIVMLEAESQKVFKDFTPREMDNKNSRKINELRVEREALSEEFKKIEAELNEAKNVKKEIEDAISEVKELEMAAEDSRWFEENVYDAGDERDEPVIERLSDEIESKLSNVLSFLLSDPMRARRELEDVIKNFGSSKG